MTFPPNIKNRKQSVIFGGRVLNKYDIFFRTRAHCMIYNNIFFTARRLALGNLSENALFKIATIFQSRVRERRDVAHAFVHLALFIHKHAICDRHAFHDFSATCRVLNLPINLSFRAFRVRSGTGWIF